MADQPQAQIIPEATQEAPMPSADQQSTGVQEATAAGPQGASTAAEEPQLSGDVKERTSEQFDKIKRQLAEERERRVRLENTFSQIKTQQTPAPQPQPGTPDYYDPTTGEVDVTKLENRLRTLEQRAVQAEQRASSAYEIEQYKQEQETFSSYPELDPKNTDGFDEDFHQMTRAMLLDSMVNQDKPLTFKQAADRVRNLRGRELKKAETQGATQALESLAPKEQASLEAQGRSDRRQFTGDHEQLVRASRNNDWMAISARLKAIPPVGK